MTLPIFYRYYAICDDCPFDVQPREEAKIDAHEYAHVTFSDPAEIEKLGWRRSPRDHRKWICPKHAAKLMQRNA